MVCCQKINGVQEDPDRDLEDVVVDHAHVLHHVDRDPDIENVQRLDQDAPSRANVDADLVRDAVRLLGTDRVLDVPDRTNHTRDAHVPEDLARNHEVPYQNLADEIKINVADREIDLKIDVHLEIKKGIDQENGVRQRNVAAAKIKNVKKLGNLKKNAIVVIKIDLAWIRNDRHVRQADIGRDRGKDEAANETGEGLDLERAESDLHHPLHHHQENTAANARDLEAKRRNIRKRIGRNEKIVLRRDLKYLEITMKKRKDSIRKKRRGAIRMMIIAVMSKKILRKIWIYLIHHKI